MSTIHPETEAVATRAWTEGWMVFVELAEVRLAAIMRMANMVAGAGPCLPVPTKLPEEDREQPAL